MRFSFQKLIAIGRLMGVAGELIPVFSKGKGADNFQGIYKNNEIYHKMRNALNHKSAE